MYRLTVKVHNSYDLHNFIVKSEHAQDSGMLCYARFYHTAKKKCESTLDKKICFWYNTCNDSAPFWRLGMIGLILALLMVGLYLSDGMAFAAANLEIMSFLETWHSASFIVIFIVLFFIIVQESADVTTETGSGLGGVVMFFLMLVICGAASVLAYMMLFCGLDLIKQACSVEDGNLNLLKYFYGLGLYLLSVWFLSSRTIAKYINKKQEETKAKASKISLY